MHGRQRQACTTQQPDDTTLGKRASPYTDYTRVETLGYRPHGTVHQLWDHMSSLKVSQRGPHFLGKKC